MLITAIRAIYGISHNKPRKVKSRVSYTVMGRLSRTERTKKTKKTGAMGGGLVGGMALCPPPGGAMGRYISLRHGTLIFCAMSFASFMSFSSFSRLSVSALHIVYCQPTLSFFRTDTIHIFPKTAIFQKIFFKCLKLPVKQYGTLF